jgi:hypothetical protein
VLFTDIVKRRFVWAPPMAARIHGVFLKTHGTAVLTACDRANLEEAGLFSVDFIWILGSGGHRQ